MAIYYEDEPKPSKICSACGGERQILHVVFETPALKSERPKRAELGLKDYRLRKFAKRHAEPLGADYD